MQAKSRTLLVLNTAMPIGKQLKELREAARMSYRDLAAKSRVPSSTIRSVEEGGDTSTENAVALAQGLGVSLEYLVTGKGARKRRDASVFAELPEYLRPAVEAEIARLIAGHDEANIEWEARAAVNVALGDDAQLPRDVYLARVITLIQTFRQRPEVSKGNDLVAGTAP